MRFGNWDLIWILNFIILGFKNMGSIPTFGPSFYVLCQDLTLLFVNVFGCVFKIGCMEPTRKYVDKRNDGYNWGKIRFQIPARPHKWTI